MYSSDRLDKRIGRELSGPPLDYTAADLHSLVLKHKVVVFRLGDSLSSEAFQSFALKLGEPLLWDFGAVLRIELDPRRGNYIFDDSDVPLHWDGAFAELAPRLFAFNCLRAAPGQGGDTVFFDTVGALADLSVAARNRLAQVTVEYSTAKVVHYGGVIRSRLIVPHPQIGVDTIRFAEPLDANTYRNPLNVKFTDPSGDCSDVYPLLMKIFSPDSRYWYHHAWRTGDVVLADNHALLHGRSKFTAPPTRVLERIHIL